MKQISSDDSNLPNVGFWSYKSARLYFSLLLALLCMAVGNMQNTLSMAMVCMVNSTTNNNTETPDDQLSSSHSDGASNLACGSVQELQEDYKGQFQWGKVEQGFMFSAVYIGGFVISIPVGLMVNKYNSKHIITIGFVGSAICCFLTPVITWYSGYVGLSVIRFIMGLFNFSLVWPPMSAMMARWIPPKERSTVIAIQTSGIQVGSIISMPLNAYLCKSNFLHGWPAIFYLNGAFGMFVCAIWVLFASNAPETNRFISTEERNYITRTLMSQNLGMRKDSSRKIPWLQMMTSGVVLTSMFCYLALSIVNVTLMTGMPTYYKEALYLSLANNGLFSAAPYMFQLVAKLLFAVVADYMKSKTKLSTTVICKIFNTISFFGVSVFMLACSFMNCNNANLAVVFISLTNLCLAANTTGFQTAIMCIAPAFVGVLAAIDGIFYNISAVLTPLIIAGFTPQGTVFEWSHVFYLIVALSLASTILFLLFGSAKIQSWAMIKNEVPNVENSDIQKVAVPDYTNITDGLENSETYNYFHSKIISEKF